MNTGTQVNVPLLLSDPYRAIFPAPSIRKSRLTLSYRTISGLAVIALTAVTACAAPTVTTTTTKPTAPSGSAKPATVARTGDTISLTGNTSGEKVAVTVVKVISHARPANSFAGAEKGDRLYAVQFRLAVTGRVAYSDSPSNGATVTDSKGQTYQSWISDVAACPSFPAIEKIAAGGSGLGCIVFQVPKSATITQVQFALDSGLADDTGQWQV